MSQADSNNYNDELIGAKETIISKTFIDRSMNKRDGNEYGGYKWAEYKTSILCKILNHNDETHAMLLTFIQNMIIGILDKLEVNLSYALDIYLEDLETDQQKDITRQYPVAQSQLWIGDKEGLWSNFYALVNFLKWIWIYINDGAFDNSCSESKLTAYLLISNFQQSIFQIQGFVKDPRENKNYPVKSKYIGISDINDDFLIRKSRNPNKDTQPWFHPGRHQCFVPYFGNFGKLIKDVRESYDFDLNKYGSLQCGISGSVNYFIILYLMSGIGKNYYSSRLLILLLVMILSGDGGHNIREIIFGLTTNIIVLQRLISDIRTELEISEDKSMEDVISGYNMEDYKNIYENKDDDKFVVIKSIINRNIGPINDILSNCGIKHKSVSYKDSLFVNLLNHFSTFEKPVKYLYEITADVNVPGLNSVDLSKLKNINYKLYKQTVYDILFKRKKRNVDEFSKKEKNIKTVNDVQLFFSIENERYVKPIKETFLKAPDIIISNIIKSIDAKDWFGNPGDNNLGSIILDDINNRVNMKMDKLGFLNDYTRGKHIPFA